MVAHRFAPAGPVQAYQTYSIASPIATHTRPASCAEIDCAAWRGGFRVPVDETSDLGAAQALFIRTHELEVGKPAQRGDTRRRYTEERDEAGRTVFTFAAGTMCFAQSEHRLPIGRPELYLVRGGDWRGSTGLIRRHLRAGEWVEDFAGHQDKIATQHERG